MLPALAPVPKPKLTLLALAKVKAEALVLVVPAEIFIFEMVAALLCMAVVRNAGTPMLNPDVLSVPTIAVPAVVAVVKPVPAYVVAMLAVMFPALAPVPRPKETLFALLNVKAEALVEVVPADTLI